ncbi:MAG: PhzF family phenazine biosynthesis protein [Beijerinckiaceae bacterium]
MRRDFFTLDVFTARPFAGNPLAVVMNGQGLDDAQMQTIAREFNVSETVFVLPPHNATHRADLRIFTPGRELPFAGHPTVGTAVLLALLDRKGGAGSCAFTLGEKVGPVPCEISVHGAQSGRAVFSLPKMPERIAAHYDGAALAGVFGMAQSEIGFDAHEPALFSAGVPFPLIPIKTRQALDAVRAPGGDALAPALGAGSGGHVFLYCRETMNSAHHFYARMFAPGSGIVEDPATGSAVAAFAGAIMAFEKPADGRASFVIEQGYAMGRPSEIELTLDVQAGALQAAHIGGSAVIVMRGEIDA